MVSSKSTSKRRTARQSSTVKGFSSRGESAIANELRPKHQDDRGQSNGVESDSAAQTFSFHADVDSGDVTESMEEIVVTLLLSGGHEYQLVLEPESPSLRQLFAVLTQPPEKRGHRLFQLPVYSGGDEATDGSGEQGPQEAAICFTGDRLVGIITDPPIYISQPETPPETPSIQQSAQSNPNQTQPSLTPGPHYAVVASPEREQSLAAGVIPSRYIQLTNFLSSDLHHRILNHAVQQEAVFVGSSTSTGDVDYRQSSVLHHFPEFADLMRGEIHRAFADVITSLKVNSFNITQVEAQLTSHNDGHYYKIHNDNGSEDTATRVLTYVYYFYQEPKPFSGGNLRIYDSRIENNYYVQADSFQDVNPINNSIVFFPSHYMHEVLPIVCPSRQFADSRFTINGWVRQ